MACFVAIFLVSLSSLTSAVNFTQVYKWPDGFDYVRPSEANRKQALNDDSFKPEEIQPLYMAVYGERTFLSLYKEYGVPATLVSLPTSSASSASPKLTPFPSWDMHLDESENCSTIDGPGGLQVDSVGRLWVLDQGSYNFNCMNKLLIFNLTNNEIELIHRFSFRGWMHDLVIDETSDGTFAYISRWSERHLVVFSLERNESWIVYTPQIPVFSIALSPKNQEPRQIYLVRYGEYELYSMSVTALRNGTRTANPKQIGKWLAGPYRMQIDDQGTMYAAFLFEDYISSLNSTQPSEEKRVYQVDGWGMVRPFTFSLDQNGTFWMMDFNEEGKPKLLKAAVGANASRRPQSMSQE